MKFFKIGKAYIEISKIESISQKSGLNLHERGISVPQKTEVRTQSGDTFTVKKDSAERVVEALDYLAAFETNNVIYIELDNDCTDIVICDSGKNELSRHRSNNGN